MRALLALLLLALPAIGAAEGAAPGHFEPWIGREAPAFTLKDTSGKEVSLADYRGKLVVIHFGASW